MGLLDKKVLLADLEEKLNDFVPANDVRKIIERLRDRQQTRTQRPASAQTWGDAIRAMDNTEMAVFICRLCLEARRRNGEVSVRRYLEFLESPVKGDDRT